jgi:plastocyanin
MDAVPAVSVLDECATGWRSAPDQVLPLTIEVEVRVEGTVPVQRVALWQDPQVPRSAWIRDFEISVSRSVDGEDFVPVPLDRPARMEPTVEQQWFSIVQPQAFGLTQGRIARGGAQATGTQPGPDVAHVRRVRLRVLSTHAASFSGEGDGHGPAVALGEIAAYGPDQELSVGIVCGGAQGESCAYTFRPRELRTLAAMTRFVYFVNDTDDAHTFTTVGQTMNADVRVGPGQSASIPFTAAGTGGRYEFFCRISDHASQGMRGMITVR